jgi:hypothetical protein
MAVDDRAVWSAARLVDAPPAGDSLGILTGGARATEALSLRCGSVPILAFGAVRPLQPGHGSVVAGFMEPAPASN